MPRRKLTDEEKAARREARNASLRPQPIAIPHLGLGAIHAEHSPSLIDTTPPLTIDIATADEQALLLERQTLTAAIIEEERELSRASFWYFLTVALFPLTWMLHYSPQFHKDVCWEVQNTGRGEDLWLFVPREHRKSFVLTIAHTLWLIICNPNIRILLVGAREETVKPFARVILSAFEEGTPGFEKFQTIFSDFVIAGRGTHLKQVFQFIHPLRTIPLPDPTFRATYLAVSGAGWRCDVLKFDDCVERRNVNTPEMSAKTTRQMMDLFPLVDTGSQYRNIFGAGTRWSYHDPYGLIIGEKQEELATSEVQTELEDLGRARPKAIVRHALEHPTQLCTHCPPHVVKAFPHGHPTMAPEALPIAEPVHTRRTLLQQYERYKMDPNLGESLFWHQYMNVCMAPSAQKFKAEWFFDVDLVDWPAPKRRVLMLDTASKDFQTENRGDWMVALFGSYDDHARMLVRHGLRSKTWTKDEFIRQIIAWCQTTGWWPTVMVKEKFGEGAGAFMADLAKKFAEFARPVHPILVTRPQQLLAKNDWIVEGLQGPMERGEILWGARVPREIRDRAEYELCNLGQVAHEDIGDCLTLGTVKGVRPEVIVRIAQPSGWEAPQLGLYEPGAAAPGPVDSLLEAATPMQQASRNQRVQIAVADLGFSDVSWDPVAGPSRPQITLGDHE